MQFLIYGEDTFRSRQKLKAISQKYIDTNLGDTNLAQLDGSKAKGEEIVRQLWIMPFLAPKRLVIIHNLISLGSKEANQIVLDFLEKIPKTTIAVFYETEKIDRRNSLFKALNQPKVAEEFGLLDPFKLRQWIKQQFVRQEINFDNQTVEFLAKNIGPDLWRMKGEIDKLASFAPEGIDLAKTQEIVYYEPAGDVFGLIDALAKRDVKAATGHLKARLQAGDNAIYLMTMMIYGFRTLLVVKDGLERNPRLSGITGVHPMVFRKTSQQVKSFSMASLKAIYGKLRDLDYDMKTGIIEPEIALEVFIFELCLGSLKEGMNEQLAAH